MSIFDWFSGDLISAADFFGMNHHPRSKHMNDAPIPESMSPLKILTDAGIHPFYRAGYEAGMAYERAKIAEHLDGWGSDCGRGGHAEHIAKIIRKGSS